MKNELPDTAGSLQKAAPARGFAVGRSFVFDKVRVIAMSAGSFIIYIEAV